ncbi:unnamed protein product [Caenorhabditis brenneri]
MSLITSLFCPSCQEPYNDTDKRPRLGACGHSVCHPCIESPVENEARENADCPICKKNNAFSEVLYNFDLCRMLEAFNEKVTEESLEWLEKNPQKLNIGVCKSCSTTERLRICVTCAETSGLFHKLPNGKFQILNSNRALHLANSVYLCSDCIADEPPDHHQHVFLQLAKLDFLEMDLEFWHYLIYAMFWEKKMAEEEKRPATDFVQGFKKIVIRYKRLAFNFDVKMRSDDYKVYKNNMKLTHLKRVDINSRPELSRAKDKSFEMAQKVIDRISKLEERHLWYHRDNIKKYLEKLTHPELNTPVFLKYKEELLALSNKFKKYRFANLTPLEAEQLDEEVKIKLEQELDKSEIYKHYPNKKKFCIYEVISNIFQNINAEYQMIKEQQDKIVKQHHAFFAERYEEVEKIKDKEMAALAHRLFLYQLVERSFKYDELIIKSLKLDCDNVEAKLMWILSYPNVIEDPEDLAYDSLLMEKFVEGRESITSSIFSRYFSGF